MDRIPLEVFDNILSNFSFLPTVGTDYFWTEERRDGYEELQRMHDARGTITPISPCLLANPRQDSGGPVLKAT